LGNRKKGKKRSALAAQYIRLEVTYLGNALSHFFWILIVKLVKHSSLVSSKMEVKKIKSNLF